MPVNRIPRLCPVCVILDNFHRAIYKAGSSRKRVCKRFAFPTCIRHPAVVDADCPPHFSSIDIFYMPVFGHGIHPRIHLCTRVVLVVAVHNRVLDRINLCILQIAHVKGCCISNGISSLIRAILVSDRNRFLCIAHHRKLHIIICMFSAFSRIFPFQIVKRCPPGNRIVQLDRFVLMAFNIHVYLIRDDHFPFFVFCFLDVFCSVISEFLVRIV